MNILVCVKQVPDMRDARMDRENNRIIREGVVSVINPYDLHAFEEGLRIKKKTKGKLTVLSMGIPNVQILLKELIAMGADDAVLLTDKAFAGADTLATSYTLSKAAGFLGPFDLILCGRQTTDGDTAQVGPGIAHMLGIVHVANALQIEPVGSEFVITHNISTGYEKVRVNAPVLITCEKDINTPGFPDIEGIQKMRKTDVKIMNANDIGADEHLTGLKGSATKVVRTFTPSSKTDALLFKGDSLKLAGELKDVLENIGIIKVKEN